MEEKNFLEQISKDVCEIKKWLISFII